MAISNPHRAPTNNKPLTRLQAFMNAESMTSAELEIAIPMARQTMGRIRSGSDLRLSTMRRILAGIRPVAGRRVEMQEIFNLEPEEEQIS